MKRLWLPVLAGALAMAALAAPSSAADLPRKAAPYYPPSAFSWTGFYAGINGGYGWGTTNWNFIGVGGSSFTVKGALVGGTVGYNVQTASYVFGLEGDLDYSTIKGSDPLICGGCDTRNSWFGTARGRIGYAADRFLPFITGGAAFGNVKMQAAPGFPTESKTRLGWTLGAGLEYAFLGNWSAKAEYLYADLGTANCSAATCFVSTDVKFKTNIVRGGLNYRF